MLEQDMMALLDRAMSPIGALGTHTYTNRMVQGSSSSSVTRHLTFPYQWRVKDAIRHDQNTNRNNESTSNAIHNLRTEIITKALQPQAGIDEHTGTIYVDSTMQKFARMDWEL